MQVQFVDAVEFRGREDLTSKKTGDKYVRFVFENENGRQFTFFESLENLPSALPDFERGKYYLLTADVRSGYSGYSCHIVGASPFN